MHGGRDERREGGIDERSALLRDLEGPSEDRLRGGRAEQDEHLGSDPSELGLEPGRAGTDLLHVGLAMDPALPPEDVLEVLDDVRDVNVVADQSRLLDPTIEEAAGRSDEGPACD